MLKGLKSISALLLCCAISGGTVLAAPSERQVSQANQQQDGTCTGVVVDETGMTVIGASVVVKGTNNGAITDLDGKFQIRNVKPGDVIVVTYVGYSPFEVTWSGKPLNITLKEDSEMLEEVVVVGYGTQKKVNLTGAVAMTEGDILENRPISNIAQGLQGAIPNLNITMPSGDPTATATFNIRGMTSINGGSALILVDGVETNDISLLNPQDIESISVLKDASSAAVYGARAAFGVVLITTKKGKKNQKVTVNYNNNFSWSSPSRLPEGMSSDKWIDAVNQAQINTNGSLAFQQPLVDAIHAYCADPTRPVAFEDTTGQLTAIGQWAYAGNTDWFDEFYKKAAFMQQHNASIQGGTEKNTYYASIGYKGQDGLLAFGTDTYKRINMSFNFTTQVTDWLEIGFRAKYNRNESDQPNAQDYMASSPYYEVYRAFPFIPIYMPDGHTFAAIEGNNFNYNIAGILAQAGRNTSKQDDVWYTGSFNLTPIKGLSIKGDFTGNRYFNTERSHFKTLYQEQPDGSVLTKGSTNSVSLRKYDDTYTALNLWAEYKGTIKDNHSYTVMVGYNQEKQTTSNMYGRAQNLYLNDFPIIDMAQDIQNLTEAATVWAVQGAFFRINYDYKGKYLLEVNGRYDGSSKYASGSQWGFFPSASIGWRLSEEKFFEPARDLFQNVKVRASVGSLGNQVTTGNFDFISTVGSRQLNYVLSGAQPNGITSPTLAYLNTTWEKVTTADFGLDINMLNNRLTASFDYYLRYTNDMIVSRTYPNTLGASGGKENLANMRTNGWELSINWTDRIKDVLGSPLEYSVGVGISDAFSTITKYDNPTGTLNDLYVGKKIGEIWGYTTEGFIQDEAEAALQADRQSYISNTWIPGDIRYADLNGDGKVNNGDASKGPINTLDNHGDLKVIGNQTPRYRFNINLGFNWKGFDVRALFEGVMKRDLWFDTTVFWGYEGTWWNALNDYIVDNSWSEDNRNAYYPVPLYGNRSKQKQTKYLQNAAYIRLRDLTVGYTLPQKWLQPLGVQALKVFFSAQNLWEATGMYKYLDPDMTGSANQSVTDANGNTNPTNLGVVTGDMKSYPFCRSFSFGINLTF